MVVDVKKLSPEERKQLLEDIRKAEEEEKNAYKQEFVNDVTALAMEKGIRWSEARSLIGNYTPSNDTEAKKLGFTHKKDGKYFHRQVNGATKLK
ncbi:hypothetical protein [Roseovarius indicus]|uniref:hypothetical protein n=1 Tax=Roseovarius indicus TaxID=540747 RepID=UPI0035156092